MKSQVKLVSHLTIHHGRRKVGRRETIKKSADIFTDFFFNLSVSFVGQNWWEPTDLGVTLNDVCADKKTKISGCFFHIPCTVIWGLPLITYAPRGRWGGQVSCTFYCILYAKRGGEGVQTACKNAYVINERPLSYMCKHHLGVYRKCQPLYSRPIIDDFE